MYTRMQTAPLEVSSKAFFYLLPWEEGIHYT